MPRAAAHSTRWTALVGAVLLALMATAAHAATPAAGEAAPAAAADGPLAATRRVLERSSEIVRGAGDRTAKLLALNDLLRGFLDTDALAELAAGKHLEGRTAAERAEFLRLFRELFVRTYVQRLLLFDAPEFAYRGERVTGDSATVGTDIVTPGDRFAVDYTLRRTPDGWRATDIRVEQISLAQNFRAQFDSALAKTDFPGLLEMLRKKLDAPAK
jgi:phospholipid transport system substrate-binding protein